MMRGKILVVDDDADHLAAASDWLSVSGFGVATVSSVEAAEATLSRDVPDVVLTDIRMPGRDGMSLLLSLLKSHPGLPVVMMTGHGDVPLAVRAMREGAYDFLEKPYDADHILAVLDRAIEKGRLTREVARLSSLVKGPQTLEDSILGTSGVMQALRAKIASLAPIDLDVTIIGETGTGKELVARALHEHSPRRGASFVAINCAAIPESIFESEIFGHGKGAFTGAGTERQGKLEFASGGTVFLDEIESMPLPLQAKMLRAIQERTVERLGENRLRPIDVRFIAAAKGDFQEMIRAGRFREDLYFRLATAELRLPPLRSRREDVPLLFAYFAGEAAQRFHRPPKRIPESLTAALMAQEWPGNVRELKACAERFALGLDLAEPATEKANGPPLPDRVAEFEAREICMAMEAVGWSSARAAHLLGIPRRTLNEKLARYRLREAGE